jgi:hypothetical protein
MAAPVLRLVLRALLLCKMLLRIVCGDKSMDQLGVSECTHICYISVLPLGLLDGILFDPPITPFFVLFFTLILVLLNPLIEVYC